MEHFLSALKVIAVVELVASADLSLTYGAGESEATVGGNTDGKQNVRRVPANCRNLLGLL
jgi:hypothetical protein